MSDKMVKVEALRTLFCDGVSLQMGEVATIPVSVAYALGSDVKVLSKSSEKREAEQKETKAKVTKDMKSKEVSNKDMSDGSESEGDETAESEK